MIIYKIKNIKMKFLKKKKNSTYSKTKSIKLSKTTRPNYYQVI